MSISIIIPSTGDRIEVLLETINASLAALPVNGGEVIVIKQKSKEITLAHSNLKLVDVDFNNVSASRNLGAELACNELLFFIDDDMQLSAENVQKCIEFDSQKPKPYLLSAIWVHSPRVEAIKEDTFLGQMLGMYLPNDSYKTRYKNVSTAGDWQDDAPFRSAMTKTFWEACFSMRRTDYLRIGGMDESFAFGNEGTAFLQRILAAGIPYYVDPTNVVIHNEWDKFNDWSIPEKRWRTEAQLVNDGKTAMKYTGKMLYFKLLYGVIIYLFRISLRALLRNISVKNILAKFYFKLFSVYAASIYWNQIHWKTIKYLRHQRVTL